MAERRSLPEFVAVSDIPLNGSITGLHLIQNDRTNERFIVGGSDDGCLAFWSQEYLSLLLYHTDTTENVPSSSLELRARWTVFTTPLTHVTHFQEDNIGPLKGCVLCVSEDGTVAVIVIDGLQL